MYANGIFTKEEEWGRAIHSLHEKATVTLWSSMRKAGIACAPHPSLEAPWAYYYIILLTKKIKKKKFDGTIDCMI